MSESMTDLDRYMLQVVTLFDTGLDTNQIAERLNQGQHVIERLLHAGLEARRLGRGPFKA